MKNTKILALSVMLVLPLFLAAQSQADLKKEAVVTKEQATATVLKRVPSGKIKEAELERENGKLVWSFDIATPGTRDITEVQVDAKTGEVVSQTTESAKHEAAEKKADSKKQP